MGRLLYRSCPPAPTTTGPRQEKYTGSGFIPMGEGISLKLPSAGPHEKTVGLKEEVQGLPDLILTNNNFYY